MEEQRLKILHERIEIAQRNFLNDVDGGEEIMNEEVNILTQPPLQLPVQPICLENTGNSCFLNSAVQSLCHLPIFTDYFLSGQYLHDLRGNTPSMAVAFTSLLRQMSSTSCDIISPDHFHNTLRTIDPRFANNHQQDVAECAGTILDTMLEETNA